MGGAPIQHSLRTSSLAANAGANKSNMALAKLCARANSRSLGHAYDSTVDRRPPGLGPGTACQEGLVQPKETYNDQIVRLFLLAAAVWGVVGMAIGVLRRRRDGLAGAQFRRAVADLQPDPARPHVRRDLRVRRIRADGHLLLRRPAHRPYRGSRSPRSPISRSGAGSSAACWRW